MEINEKRRGSTVANILGGQDSSNPGSSPPKNRRRHNPVIDSLPHEPIDTDVKRTTQAILPTMTEEDTDWLAEFDGPDEFGFPQVPQALLEEWLAERRGLKAPPPGIEVNADPVVVEKVDAEGDKTFTCPICLIETKENTTRRVYNKSCVHAMCYPCGKGFASVSPFRPEEHFVRLWQFV